MYIHSIFNKTYEMFLFSEQVTFTYMMVTTSSKTVWLSPTLSPSRNQVRNMLSQSVQLNFQKCPVALFKHLVLNKAPTKCYEEQQCQGPNKIITSHWLVRCAPGNFSDVQTKTSHPLSCQMYVQLHACLRGHTESLHRPHTYKDWVLRGPHWNETLAQSTFQRGNRTKPTTHSKLALATPQPVPPPPPPLSVSKAVERLITLK